MKFSATPLAGMRVIEPKVFADDRGFFMETYHEDKFHDAEIPVRFVQDNHSRSHWGVLRGLHYQLAHPQAKLLRVVRGEIFDVAVDLRRSSPTFGRWFGMHLSEEKKSELYVPGEFAHGFCVLSEIADVAYKCSDIYRPEDEHTIVWNDADLGIDWPISRPVVSEKDSRGVCFKDAPCFR